MLWHGFEFQERRRPVIKEIKIFHDHSLVIITLILIVVLYLIFYMLFNKIINNSLISGHLVEFFWTIFPFLILIVLAVPRIKLLYIMEESYEPLITLKIIGHQWYWSYQYSDFTDLQFDSYIIPEREINIREHRLLETDCRIVLPINEIIRGLITRDDVIHRWSVPRIGIKCDAVPGRLNQIQFYPNRVGLFYGQCSEICGANHSFIPIAIEIISLKDFIKWV